MENNSALNWGGTIGRDKSEEILKYITKIVGWYKLGELTVDTLLLAISGHIDDFDDLKFHHDTLVRIRDCFRELRVSVETVKKLNSQRCKKAIDAVIKILEQN